MPKKPIEVTVPVTERFSIVRYMVGDIAHLSSVIEDEKNHLSMKLGIGKVNILQKLDLLQTAVLRLE